MNSKRMPLFGAGILLYGIVGPPLGMLVITIIGIEENIRLHGYVNIYGPLASLGSLPIWLIAYYFGLLPALGIGVVVSAGQSFYRDFCFGHVVLIGGLAYPHFLDGSKITDTDNVEFVLVCCIPTVLCWLVIVRWHKRAT